MANSPARSKLDVGSVVGGTYTLEAVIGRGGMGAVFLARNNRLPGKKVAIKLLHVELHDDDVIARFRREATIAAELDHPNIIRVDDYNVTDDGTPYLVLEYLQGESLAARIARGPLPIDQVMAIVRQVGSGLAAAHRAGIVHRDLKPQNIFLVPREVDGHASELAKVLDFGISKIRGSQTVQTQESTLLGTPQYMAPEQATGQHASVDERTDIFALGAIVYEMLCGQPAFTGQSIPEVVFKVVYEAPVALASRTSVAPAIVAAVERAMAKPAADRFPSMSAFVEAVTGQPLAAPRASVERMPEITRATRPGDAFANTVDSGQHPNAVGPSPTIAAGPASGSTGGDATTADAINPHAQTVASHAGGEVAPVPPAPVRKGRLLIPLGFALLVAGAIVGFVMMRGERPGTAIATATDAGAARAPDATATLAIPAPPADAAALVPDAARAAQVPDAAAPRPRPPRPTQPPAEPAGPDEPDDEDPALAAKLAQAHAAYRAEQWDRAERLANQVIDATSKRGLLARAHALRGAIQCVHHHHRGRARTALRAIRVARWQSWLVKACGAAGIDLR